MDHLNDVSGLEQLDGPAGQVDGGPQVASAHIDRNARVCPRTPATSATHTPHTANRQRTLEQGDDVVHHAALRESKVDDHRLAGRPEDGRDGHHGRRRRRCGDLVLGDEALLGRARVAVESLEQRQIDRILDLITRSRASANVLRVCCVCGAYQLLRGLRLEVVDVEPGAHTEEGHDRQPAERPTSSACAIINLIVILNSFNSI